MDNNKKPDKISYKLKLKFKLAELDMESTDKDWIEETLAVFISMATDDQKLDDAIEKINAMIEDIESTPSE